MARDLLHERDHNSPTPARFPDASRSPPVFRAQGQAAGQWWWRLGADRQGRVAGALLAACGTPDVHVAGLTPGRTSKIMTVNYDYLLCKRTNVYAIYLSDKFTGLTNGTTFAAGLKHRF